MRDVISTDQPAGPAVVTISAKDYGFETIGCGKWSSRLNRVTKSRNRFGAGTYILGTDIAPGIYASSGTGQCSWARLGSFGGRRGRRHRVRLGRGPSAGHHRAP